MALDLWSAVGLLCNRFIHFQNITAKSRFISSVELSKMREKRPNFFVVGAPKAATSSLNKYLGQHPDIFIPRIKEPHYFSYPEVSDTYYRIRHITYENEYLKLYKDMLCQKIAGDISPSYLFYRSAAERIKRFDSDARIIIVLRNPVERAISHYLMDVREGIQREALSTFFKKTESNRLYFKEYIEIGMYYGQVKNYLEEFGQKQVLVLLYDEIYKSPAQTLEKIYRFLGVNADFVPDLSVMYNTHQMLKYKFLRTIKNRQLVKSIVQVLPGMMKSYLKGRLIMTEKPAFREEKKQLREIYYEDIQKLSKLLSLDLGSWLIIENNY